MCLYQVYAALPALYHDIGRWHDGVCEDHGRYSVEKMKRLGFAPADRESAEILEFIITYHAISDAKGVADANMLPPDFRARALCCNSAGWWESIMIVTVHRGTRQIGGTCNEVATENTRNLRRWRRTAAAGWV